MNRSPTNHFFSSLKRVEDRLAGESKEERRKMKTVSPFSPQRREYHSNKEEFLEKKRKKNVVGNLHDHLDHSTAQTTSSLFYGYNQAICPEPFTGSTRTPDSHNSFFSSLKQVENRLALENQEEKKQKIDTTTCLWNRQHSLNVKEFFTTEKREKDGTKETFSSEPSDHPVEQFSSPIFVGLNQTANMINPAGNSAQGQESEPPWEFISHLQNGFSDDSITFRSVPIGLAEDANLEIGERRYEDVIKQLMDLLGLLAVSDITGDDDCLCSGGSFYSRIVGVKGPKCGQERRRLDGWIEYYNNQNSEPARLAHLLLARAVCMSEENSSSVDNFDDLDFRAIGFPSTVHEFLKHDPSKHTSS